MHQSAASTIRSECAASRGQQQLGQASQRRGRQTDAGAAHLGWGLSTPPAVAARYPLGTSDVFILPPPLEAWGSLEQGGQHVTPKQHRAEK